jgi:hypothetical protein
MTAEQPSEAGLGPRLDRLAAVAPEHRTRIEATIVRDLVDPAYYAHHNGDILEPGEDPVQNFCRVGWKALRKPRADFDVWWYWLNHLDPSSDAVNPLVHYALSGRAQRLSTRPESTRARPGHRLEAQSGGEVRRACLFAGYDADQVIDESVLLLIRELARFCDVYYLADGYLPPEELAKLDGITAGAWAIRHGSYDFGSYAMLARELVGWEALEAYDEVLFVNDSCFLLRPLDEVFAEMADRPCDWWGLQATKGLASTAHEPSNRFTRVFPLDEVRERMLDEYEDDPVYDFHVGSYFLAFRRPVLDDPLFRRLIDSVAPQRGKLLVVLKYEVGLTHLLIGRGFAFDTFVPALHPFHPMFSETHFTLIAEGFPLLKRYLIGQNHYDMPGLADWADRIRALTPDAPVDLFARTLARTAPDDRVQHSLAITQDADGRVVVPKAATGKALLRRDRKVPKHDDRWVFVVDPGLHVLPDNSRALMEAVRDEAIELTVLTRSRRIAVPGIEVTTAPLLSRAGRQALLSAGRVFVAKQPRASVRGALDLDQHEVVVVRDGLILERDVAALRSPQLPPPVPPARVNGPDIVAEELLHATPEPNLTGLLVASRLDRLAAVATYRPATYDQAWLTGLPAHDFLHRPYDALPADLREQEAAVRRLVDGRRLLLFLPTVRDADGAPAYPFSPAEVDRIRAWAERSDVVLGIRERIGDEDRPYTRRLGEHALDLSHRRFPSLHAVLRAADAVLTDHASAALDFAVLGRPLMAFVHDPVAAAQRVVLDLDHFFPGPVAHDFDELIAGLEGLLDGETPELARHRARVRSLLVDHLDDGNSARVVEMLKNRNGAPR